VVSAGAALAHPHEFITATLGFDFDARGDLVGVTVAWRYDELTSMLILSDLGLNPAMTALDETARAALHGFDLDWDPGYNGDLWPEADGMPFDLGPPQALSVEMDAGVIVSRHRRAVTPGIDPAAQGLAFLVYDPEYYIAYTVAVEQPARAGCVARVYVPDFGAASERLQGLLAELFPGGDAETGFPAVGRDFAEEVRLECE
jgi:ABC-type uncharacterized transport system substrate-binding protein